MTDDIVARLRIWSDNAKEQDATDIVVGLCEAADEIERLREERNQLRAEVVDRALGINADVPWDIHSPLRKRCENYARQRGWHGLFDAVNEEERIIRERIKR